ncbi:MAG: PIN domain-containing protein [Chloroflexi bacterium]|nr:PIN domain-containing protein [Chloroflexota bacterium]MCC6892336.1 PIN domain-containing protein [Anaerolineae bacterium]
MTLDGLLDTNIFIDIARHYSSAIAWLNSQHLQFGVSSITRIELMLGARNKAEVEKIDRMLRPFQLIFPDARDSQWAMEQFERFNLSHQLEIFDCYIAASAIRLGLPVVSRNVRDLSLLPSVLVQVPY